MAEKVAYKWKNPGIADAHVSRGHLTSASSRCIENGFWTEYTYSDFLYESNLTWRLHYQGGRERNSIIEEPYTYLR